MTGGARAGASLGHGTGKWRLTEQPSLKGFVLEWAEPGFFILSKRNRLYTTKSLDERFSELVEFPAPLWKETLSKARIAQRFFRFMFYNVVRSSAGALFITFHNRVGVYSDGRFRTIDGLIRPARVLRSACAVDDEKRIFFGEYRWNNERGPVHIYKYVPGAERLEVACTFSPGEIRHIHGVYYDPFEGHLYCTTGDRGAECRIVRSRDGFKTVETVGAGDETWRSVSLLFTKDAIYYGTDAEFEQNRIYRLDRFSGKREPLADVEGPIYYSYQCDDDLFFVVTAEICDIQKGHQVIMWHLAKDRRCSRVAIFDKDLVPSSGFQKLSNLLVMGFMPGILHFPQGPGIKDRVYFHAIGLKNADNRMFLLRKEH